MIIVFRRECTFKLNTSYNLYYTLCRLVLQIFKVFKLKMLSFINVMMWRLTQHSNWELRLGRSHSILALSYHRLSHDPDKVVPGEVLGSRPVQNTGGFLSCRVEQDNPDRDIITGSRYSSDICLWFDVIVQLLADNVDRNTDDGNDASLVSDLMRSSICSALVIFTSAWMKNLKQNLCIYEESWMTLCCFSLSSSVKSMFYQASFQDESLLNF